MSRRRMRRPREKAVQYDVKNLYQQIGGLVWDTSQPFAAKITPGVPDLFVALPRCNVAFFHEVKSARGKLSLPQQRFAETAMACDLRVVVGGVPEAVEWLYELGVLMRPDTAEFVSAFPGSQVGWVPNPQTECWEWIGALAWNGYGIVGLPGQHRNCLAHRLVYEREHGPVPDGQELDHLCRNRRCVNPGHLEVVTRRTNARRGAKAKLSPALIRQLHENYTAGGVTLRDLGRECGVSHGHLSRVFRGSRGYWRGQ